MVKATGFSNSFHNPPKLDINPNEREPFYFAIMIHNETQGAMVIALDKDLKKKEHKKV
jgi:hypothetical protein